MTSGPPRARGLSRALGVVLFVALAGCLAFLAMPAGRAFLFGARVRQATGDPAVAPTVLAGLFGQALKQGLAPAGVDTALLRAESISEPPGDNRIAGRHHYRWEVPLPRGVTADSAGTIFRAALARFDGESFGNGTKGAQPGLVSGLLRGDIAVEVLLLPADARLDGRPRLAILIAEFRYPNLAEWEELLSIARGVTVAIPPHATGARDLADRCRQKGLEVVIDLPMEGLDYPKNDPGPGAILVDLSEREIIKRLGQAFDRLGGADGVHTYQGNLAIEDRKVMRTVLFEVHRRKVYFLDSTKTAFSAVEAIAEEMGLQARRVRPGLDWPKATSAQMEVRLEELAASARERGVAVGVVRPYPGTLAALKKLLPIWAASGLEVVPVSEVVTVPKVAPGPLR
ncbi:MAG: divergent polysaccharide deacetylase family protein [Candidatus Eisenbacteria bacterium]|nr:divergent polysaccharide deacetylase family protein [Candidatus Eisenbacteria bacterium]